MIAHGYPLRLLPCAPREHNNMPHRAVKRFLRCSENWNLTDALEQQLSRTGCLNVCGFKHQRNKDYNKIICLLELAAATGLARTRPARRAARATFLGREGWPAKTVRSEGLVSCLGQKATVFGY